MLHPIFVCCLPLRTCTLQTGVVFPILIKMFFFSGRGKPWEPLPLSERLQISLQAHCFSKINKYMDQWINKTKIDLYKVFWSYSEIYIYSIHFYYILITTKCESHIDCLLCFTSSVVIRLWKQLYTYNYNYTYCNWTKSSQLGEGDNPKINPPSKIWYIML